MRNVLFFLAAAALVFSACEQVEPGIRMEFIQRQFSVRAGLNPRLSASFPLDDLPTEHDRFEAENGVAWEDWSRVTAARASLIINEPGLDWGFANEVVLLAFDQDDPTVQREIFYRDQIPLDVGARLDMIPSELNVKELFGGERFGVILQLRQFNGSPRQGFPVLLQWSFQGYQD